MKKSSTEAVNTRLGSDPPRHSNYSHHAFTKLMLELDPAPCDLPEWRLNINGWKSSFKSHCFIGLLQQYRGGNFFVLNFIA